MADNDPMLDPTFKYSINTFPGDGVTTLFNLSFVGGYISRDHVKAYTVDAIGATEDRAITWIGPNQVSVSPAVASGLTLVIYRDTPKNVPIVDFNDGAVINEPNLDVMAKQAVFATAEMFDRFSEISDQSGLAAEQAQSALAQVSVALVEAHQALMQATEAGQLATDTANQFDALLETVQDLSGLDLSGIARTNLPQTFGEPQVFRAMSIQVGTAGTEFSSNGEFRVKTGPSTWSAWRSFNDWAELTGKPSSYPPSAHGHTWGEIAGKPSAYPPIPHTHTWGDVTGKPTEFPPVPHAHAWSTITDRPNVAVQDQSASFLSLTSGGVRVPHIYVGSGTPSGMQAGDLWFLP